MNDSVIVLGGTGFLGKAIIRSLLKAGYKDLATVSRNKKIINDNVKSFEVDILDQSALKKVIKPYKIIINCSGQITNPISNCFRLNSEGIFNIAKSVANTNKKVVHISTVGLYGTAKKVDEDSFINPETPYSTCKSIAEYFLKKEIKKSQLTIIRLSNVYGIESKGILTYLYRSFISDKTLIIKNNGELLRYFIEVNDAADNIVRLISKKYNSGIFNLVGNEKYTIKQLVQKIELLTNIKYKTKYDLNIKPYENIINISGKKIREHIKLKFQFSINKFINKYFVAN